MFLLGWKAEIPLWECSTWKKGMTFTPLQGPCLCFIAILVKLHSAVIHRMIPTHHIAWSQLLAPQQLCTERVYLLKPTSSEINNHQMPEETNKKVWKTNRACDSLEDVRRSIDFCICERCCNLAVEDHSTIINVRQLHQQPVETSSCREIVVCQLTGIIVCYAVS